MDGALFQLEYGALFLIITSISVVVFFVMAEKMRHTINHRQEDCSSFFFFERITNQLKMVEKIFKFIF